MWDGKGRIGIDIVVCNYERDVGGGCVDILGKRRVID